MNRLLLLITLCGLLFSSCEVLDDLTRFQLDYETSTVVQANTVVDLPLTLSTPDVETNSSYYFEQNSTSKDLVEEVVLDKMELSISSPAEGSFRFLKSIQFFIVAEGMPELEIASKENIENTVGAVLELETTHEDLQEYVKKDAFSLRVKVLTDEVITEDHEITAKAVFGVNAKILGI